MSFENKVVLVTGGSSGIGAGIAKSFAKEGAKVAIVGRNETKLAKVAEECGLNTLIINADLSKDNDVKRVMKETIEALNQLDVLVNNAGILRFGSLLSGNIMDSYDEVMNVNLKAYIHLTSLAAPYLVKTKGNVINIASVSATSLPLTPQWTVYNVSKAAIEHFTRIAAAELAPTGVRVNAISPGPTETDMGINSGYTVDVEVDFKIETALDRVSKAEEVGDLAVFIASDKGKCITGSVVVADNGYLLKNP